MVVSSITMYNNIQHICFYNESIIVEITRRMNFIQQEWFVLNIDPVIISIDYKERTCSSSSHFWNSRAVSEAGFLTVCILAVSRCSWRLMARTSLISRLAVGPSLRTSRGSALAILPQLSGAAWLRGSLAMSISWSLEVERLHFYLQLEDFTITEKAPTKAFSWLKAPTSAFTFIIYDTTLNRP